MSSLPPAAASDQALQTEALTKSYGDVVAVDRLTVAVAKGQTTALLGGNGAGKTTTISMLLGLLLPTSGRITVLGEDLLAHRHRVLPFMNFSSPYVDLPFRLTVEQNLMVYAGLYGVTSARQRVHELAEQLELTPYLKRMTGKLSAGQKTRVVLAKALINRPQVLLLDEPTASLDPDTGDWVRRFLMAYQQDTQASILLASHNMAEVEMMAGHVLMMKAGRLVDEGSPAQLLTKYGQTNLEEVFLDVARDRKSASAEVSEESA